MNGSNERAMARVPNTYEKPQGGFLAIGPRYPGVPPTNA